MLARALWKPANVRRSTATRAWKSTSYSAGRLSTEQAEGLDDRLGDRDLSLAAHGARLDVAETTLAMRAAQSTLADLTTTVGTKAAQSSLDALTATVGAKAAQSSLDALTTAVGAKAAQSSLDTLTSTVNDKAAQSALDQVSGNLTSARADNAASWHRRAPPPSDRGRSPLLFSSTHNSRDLSRNVIHKINLC